MNCGAWLIKGLLLVTFLFAAAGCGSDAAVLSDPANPGGGFTAANFLPQVNTVESGDIELDANGRFNGSGDSLVFTEPASSSRITIADQTRFFGPGVFSREGENNSYINLTLRSLSAQAAASVSARDSAGAVAPATFYKVAGVSILPLATRTSSELSVVVPVSAAAAPTAGKVLDLYVWRPTWTSSASGFTHSTGFWEFVEKVSVDSSGNTVTFGVAETGQYAVVSTTIS